MGYSGLLKQKMQAQALRRKGLSYREILVSIKVSKSTISKWCKDIKLTRLQKNRLTIKKQFGQRKGSIVAAENKRRVRIQRTLEIRKEAKRFLGKRSKRDLFLTGIALYAAEGSKTDRQVGFANSDPLLIKFMMQWFLKYLRVPLKKTRGSIWLHEGLNEKVAKEFWSDLTGIPLDQFHKTYIAKVKPESKKIRKNIHKYGVFSIRFTDAEKHRKIMGWIYALFDDKIG